MTLARQTDLKLDYDANIARYPLYHQYLRTHRPLKPTSMTSRPQSCK